MVGCVPLKAHFECKSQDALHANSLKSEQKEEKKDRAEEVVHDEVPYTAWDDLLGLSGAKVAQ